MSVGRRIKILIVVALCFLVVTAERSVQRWDHHGHQLKRLGANPAEDMKNTKDLFVFVTPPASLMFQHISLVLETFKRQVGNILVLTLAGYTKAFEEQAKYVKISDLDEPDQVQCKSCVSNKELSSIFIWTMGEVPLFPYHVTDHTKPQPFDLPSLNAFGLPTSPFKIAHMDSYALQFSTIFNSFESALEEQDPKLDLFEACQKAQQAQKELREGKSKTTEPGTLDFKHFAQVPTDCEPPTAVDGIYGAEVAKIIYMFNSASRKLAISPGLLPGTGRVFNRLGIKFVATIPTAMWADLMDVRWVQIYHHSVELRNSFRERAVDLVRGLYMKLFMNDSPFGFPIARHPSDAPMLNLVLSHPFLASPRALPPSIVFTGAVVAAEREDPSHISDASADVLKNKFPVVLVSFGTHAVLDDAAFRTLAEGLLPDLLLNGAGVTGKEENDEEENQWSVIWTLPKRQKGMLSEETLQRYVKSVPGRISFEAWTSTPALLAHENLKIFASHCGGNSLGEALRAGKPVIGLPAMAEQPWNCAVASRNMNFITCHPLYTLSADELRADIERILFDRHDSSIESAGRMRLLSKQVFSGAALAVDWIQFAIASDVNNTAPLVTREDRQGRIRAAYLDVAATAVFILLFVATVTAFKAGKIISKIDFIDKQK